ncbi:helicase-like protein [Leishmania major strain Friedlin]|uniref:Probable helicase A859L n=1 Tax=Leishmania major TaxID=5664 RepID=Q4Q6Q7_LEIMA|nr:helicase-like protein [Leishmania major strain Friedlin]CAG9579155.1 helicase-like_protein [Leishmania major strain Friedlin]CAJ08152.1 helicase-like protein [Leishmania major strain Friedlin]|eukprot:XP_001684991.1 helicase-like protein [Leishmania major strain Friedlin]
MLGRSSCRLQTIGFYVAQHPWLKAAGFVKIGYSTCLETRLDMASFTTCFTPEWHYVSVFECETSKEALLLEQSVLFCLSAKRVEHRELIRLSEDEVTETAAVLARKLRLSVVQRVRPHYEGTLATAPSAKPRQQPHRHTFTDLKAIVTEEEPDATPLSPTMASTTIAPYREVLDGVKADMHTPPSSPHEDVHPAVSKDEEDEEGLSSGDFSFLSTWIDRNDYSLDMLRPYQQEAVTRLMAELRERKKAVCQMACRCGKTPVAYHIIQRTLQESGSGRVLYLVPGLSLLRQTVRKLVAYGLRDAPLLLIGSDPLPVVLRGNNCQSMTTNPDVIRETILGNPKVVVVSTYHSSPLLKELNIFQLTVFDECHRVCGSDADTAFNTVLKLPLHGQRLFLTATPTYDTPIKMSDTGYFGGIAYRYYLREGINDGYVNPFSVRVVLGGNMSHMNPYLFEAMRMVNKMLVFCRDIAHALKIYEELVAETPPSDVAAFSVLIAHSRMGGAAVAHALQSFTTAKRCLLLNVRLFQEGVEIPDLNAVFFAAPRYSSRDIIQSICRPLNRMEGKSPSFVFLPAVYDRRYAADHPINLQSFSTLIPFTDALMDEDPKLFEYMIDPHKKSYDIDVVGVRSLRLTSEKLHRFVLPAIRRGVRYSTRDTDRLHRAARLPWKSIFEEMKRIVYECNRYPKTNDAWVVGGTPVSMNMFYQYVRRGYKMYERGESTYLQVHQLRDLESLPQWRRYGVHGPYPWKECLQTLERHLRAHKTVPPLDIHKGGYVGLDATPFERLAGCLMNVNQADSRLQVGLPPAKQADLDRLCAPYRLRWRKRRAASGAIVKNDVTMITQSYMQFKQLYENADKVPAFQRYLELHFPGYPQKHVRMETLDNLRKGIVPPRRAQQPRQQKKGRKLRGKQVASAAAKGRTVMCRICREHVSVLKWESHLSSKTHLHAQKTLL